jgi:hypothetical protein
MKIKPKEAKAKLEAFLKLQEDFQAANQAVTQAGASGGYGYGIGPAHPAVRKKVAELTAARESIRARLHHHAEEVGRLLWRADVQPFYVQQPEHGMDTVRRGIGVYALWAETGIAPPEPVRRDGEKKPRWWRRGTPVWGTVAATIIAGIGSALVTAYLGERVTCSAGQERTCEPYGGESWVQVCNASGLGHGDCFPISQRSWLLEHRQLDSTPPAASPPPPATP